jgi:PPOX class probable F420-dependent enzyme
MTATVVPASHQNILEAKGFAHVATIGPGGAPQSSPVWFLWDGDTLKISLTKARQKYKNLQRNPHVAVSVTDPADPYRYVEVRGTVTFEDDPDKAFIDQVANKYLGQNYPWNQPDEERVVVTIQPTHATTMG